MEKSDEQVLRDFLINIECLKPLENRTANINLFEILGVTNKEIRHSNILAWLFDSNANHGLGDSFIKKFFNTISLKYYKNDKTAFDLLLQDFSSFTVKREDNNMDIVLDSYQEKTVVIIENKIWAGELSHQLNKYYTLSQNVYPNYQHYIYIYLTPDGKEPKKNDDKDIWHTMSYEDLMDILENVVDDTVLSDEVMLILENYKYIVMRNIMREVDEELKKWCIEIYNKHKNALNLIFENTKIQSNSIESEAIPNALIELANNGKIIYHNDNTWNFFTKEMNEYLPVLSDSNSSWGTNWVYYYWFSMNGNDLQIHFEVGGWGVSKDTYNKMVKISELSGKGTPKDKFRYRRTYLGKVLLKYDYDESDINKAVKELVEGALRYQHELFKKIK